jgi:hypothetical protein
MMALKDNVSEFTGSAPMTPIAEIEELLQLVQGANHPSKFINLPS